MTTRVRDDEIIDYYEAASRITAMGPNQLNPYNDQRQARSLETGPAPRAPRERARMCVNSGQMHNVRSRSLGSFA